MFPALIIKCEAQALEGIAYRARDILGHLDRSMNLPVTETVRVDGGLTQSRAFLQILADVIQKPVPFVAIPKRRLWVRRAWQVKRQEQSHSIYWQHHTLTWLSQTEQKSRATTNNTNVGKNSSI